MSAAAVRARRVLADAGLRGSVLARDLRTGHQVAVDADHAFPLASVAKLPLAAAVLDRAARGEVDLAMPVTIDANNRSRGGPGLARFSHPATVAVGDLLTLAIELSDNTAADALFRLLGPVEVTRWLEQHGVRDLVLRHPIEALYDSLALRLGEQDSATVTALVAAAAEAGHRSPLPELDLDNANTGTASAIADLLGLIWSESLDQQVSGPLREAMGGNLMRHRLAPDFASDAARWSSKTGTFVHLRHEAGVVEHEHGDRIAVVALTASSVPAITQPLAEQAIGHAARLIHDDVLRTASWD